MSSHEQNRGRGRTAPSRLRNAAKDPGWILLILFVVVACVLCVRILYLQTVRSAEYSALAQDQRTSTIALTARRGTIYDRNGTVLATTIDATTIYANPYEVTDIQGEAASIAAVLGGEASDYTDALSMEDVSFAYLYRKADVDVAKKLEDLELPGIYFLPDSKRVYPYEGVGSQIVGVTDVDGNGISGLELQYDDQLKGTDGTLSQQRGLYGTPISGGVVVQAAAIDGKDITVSLDEELQEHVEQTLSSALSTYAAAGGSITVYDGGTGEVYATASSPLLHTGADWRDSEGGAFVLNTVSDSYEPGSTFKSVTTAAVLEEGAVTPDTVFDIPAQLNVDTNVVKDSHEHGDITYTTAGILQQSSNIGMVLESRLIPRQTLYDYYLKFGFGQDCGIDFPGSTQGLINDCTTWSETEAANVPFGQGVSTSAMQIVRAYGVFTNGGVMCTPHFLMKVGEEDHAGDWATTRVVSSKTAQTMTDMLITVVTEGTGWPAALPDYAVAGKTGTAEKVDPSTGTYYKDRYNISFCGYLPNTDSKLVCLVVLDNPNYGSVGPVFAEVMSYVADLYKVSPNR